MKSFTEILNLVNNSNIKKEDRKGILDTLEYCPSILNDIEERSKEFDFTEFDLFLKNLPQHDKMESFREDNTLYFILDKETVIALDLKIENNCVFLYKVSVGYNDVEILCNLTVREVIDTLELNDIISHKEVTKIVSEDEASRGIRAYSKFVHELATYIPLYYIKKVLEQVYGTDKVEYQNYQTVKVMLSVRNSSNKTYKVFVDVKDKVNVIDLEDKSVIEFSIKNLNHTEITGNFRYLKEYYFVFNHIPNLINYLNLLGLYHNSVSMSANLLQNSNVSYNKNTNSITVTNGKLVAVFWNTHSVPSVLYEMENGDELNKKVSHKGMAYSLAYGTMFIEHFSKYVKLEDTLKQLLESEML